MRHFLVYAGRLLKRLAAWLREIISGSPVDVLARNIGVSPIMYWKGGDRIVVPQAVLAKCYLPDMTQYILSSAVDKIGG